MKTPLLVAAALLAAPALSHGEDLPRIRVDGNRFVKPDGGGIIFRGFSPSEPGVMKAKDMWKPATFQAMAGWGANLVRIPVHPEAWREHGREAYLKLLDDGIAMAAAEGMHVIIDWHSIGNLLGGRFFGGAETHPTSAYQTSIAETFAFWKIIAKRYGKNPNVAFFELFNEPALGQGMGEVPWSEWRELMEKLIAEIRAEGAEAIPLVAGFDFAYDLKPVMSDPIRAENIGYVSHPYPGKIDDPAQWEQGWTRDWGHVAAKYPVILTEIGFQYEDQPNGYDPINGTGHYANFIHEYTAKRGISYVVWCFDDCWVPSLITDSNYTPSRPGLHFRTIMRRAAGLDDEAGTASESKTP